MVLARWDEFRVTRCFLDVPEIAPELESAARFAANRESGSLPAEEAEREVTQALDQTNFAGHR